LSPLGLGYDVARTRFDLLDRQKSITPVSGLKGRNDQSYIMMFSSSYTKGGEVKTRLLRGLCKQNLTAFMRVRLCMHTALLLLGIEATALQPLNSSAALLLPSIKAGL
jgi:hypothetical protein